MTGHLIQIHRRRTGHYRFRARCAGCCRWLGAEWANQVDAEEVAVRHASENAGQVEFTLVQR